MCQKGWIGVAMCWNEIGWVGDLCWYQHLKSGLWDVIYLDLLFQANYWSFFLPCDSSYGFQYHLVEYLFIANFHKINLLCKHASFTKSITDPYTVLAWFVYNPSFTKSIFLYWIFVGSLFWRNSWLPFIRNQFHKSHFCLNSENFKTIHLTYMFSFLACHPAKGQTCFV